MEKKYCVYLCSGCGIGEALDMEALAEVARGEMSMECKTLSCMCGKEGRALLQKDCSERGINTIVIGGCSPRVMKQEFYLGPGTITCRANLREQVVWSEIYPSDDRAAQEQARAFLNETAQDYIRMECTRALKTDLPESYLLEEGTNKKILVMGGGLAGMTSALEAASAGYQVTIVEKEARLGGRACGWRKSFPSHSPWTDLEENPVEAKIAQVQVHENIFIRYQTEVARIAGSPGAFRVSMKPANTLSCWDAPVKITSEERDKIEKGEMEDPNRNVQEYVAVDEGAELFGSVVLATGWIPADVKQYAHLGYGTVPGVVTNAEFEKMAKEGQVPANVAFVMSPGGKDHDRDFPYCNSVTSMVALKQAQYVCNDNSDGKAYILYQHMRTPGSMELFYKKTQLYDGIFMTKGCVTQVREKNGRLCVEVEDTLLGDSLEIGVDMVVLAAGMEPVTLYNSSINLAYRQGPGFSDIDLFEGYADSHFICFPYETRRTGIYTCGAVRKSMTMDETIDDATGAALKAIQCVESTDRGVSVHPRSGDATYPEFFMQRCTQCKRCTEECPFGALDDDKKGTPLPNPTRCRRCGTCMGACPERIIGFKDYSIDLISSMIKAIDVPEDDDDRLRVLVFVCENDAYPALDMSGMRRHGLSHMVRFIPVRCLGSVNMAWIRDAMSAGIDGAMLLGCKYGDDYQCHFVKGSELADKRMENIGDTLATLGLEAERVVTEQVAITDYNHIPQLVNGFVQQIVEMGPNPFKGY